MKFAWSLGMVKDAGKRVNDPKLLWKILQEYADGVVGVGNQVELVFSDTSSLSTQTYLSTANAMITAKDILGREAGGLHGVILAGSIDPGLDEIRSSTLMPVVGLTEAALAVAGFVGRRVGIITVKGSHDPLSFARVIEGIACKYGCADRLLKNRPVRTIREGWEEGYRYLSQAIRGDGENFIKSFDNVAEEFLNDGADVIICGNQLFGPILHRLGRRSVALDGVPIVCNVAAALKAVQLLADLKGSVGLVKSNFGVFHALPSSFNVKSVL